MSLDPADQRPVHHRQRVQGDQRVLVSWLLVRSLRRLGSR
jgi:hypothetical protein